MADFTLDDLQAIPAPLRNNNPVALKPGGKMAQYASLEEGWQAADKNLEGYPKKYGTKTLEQVIQKWSGGDQAAAYTARVSSLTGIKATDPVDLSNPSVRKTLLTAMAAHENGQPAPRASKGPDFTLDDLQSRSTVKPGEPVKGEAGSSFSRQAATEIAGIADMFLSTPGMAFGVLGDMASRMKSLVTGVGHKEASRRAQETYHQIADPSGQLATNTLRRLGWQGDIQSGAGQLGGLLSSMVDWSGETIESATNGALNKEDVQSLSNEFMALAGVKGMKVGASAIGKKMVKEKPKAKADPRFEEEPPEPETPPAGEPPEPETPPAGNGPEDVAATRGARMNDLAKKGGQAFATSDMEKTAEATAYKLMQEGASKKTVESIRKSNPQVGEALDRMMERRKMAIEALGGAIQGEELPPAEDFRPGFKEVRREGGTKTSQSPMKNRQLGQAALGLTAGIAGVSVGALLDQNDPVFGALMGLGLSSLLMKGIGKMSEVEKARVIQALDPDRVMKARDLSHKINDIARGATDAGTVIHEHNTAALAETLAKRLGLSREGRTEVAMAALVHDVGKHGMEHIIQLPRSLTPEERAVIQQHPEKSAKMLLEMGVPQRIAQIAGQHHMDIGGGGYPAANGERLQFASQILHVADIATSVGTQDAGHAYVRGASVDKALSILKGHKGLNPEIVKAFEGLVEERRLPRAFYAGETKPISEAKTPSEAAMSFTGGQAGIAHPAILAAVAGMVAGGMMNKDDPILGGLIGLGVSSLFMKGIGKLTDAQRAHFAKLGGADPLPDMSKVTDPNMLSRTMHWIPTNKQADLTILRQHAEAAREAGITPEMDRMFRDFSEGSIKSLPPAMAAKYEKFVTPIRKALANEFNKIRDPKERALVDTEIRTRAAKNHRAWWDSIGQGREGYSPTGMSFPSILKGRTVFALEDGTIITVKDVGGGRRQVKGWRSGVPTDLGTHQGPLKAGDVFKGNKLVEAKQADIETHTPIRYLESDIATHSLKLAELKAYNRQKAFWEALTNSEAGKSFIKKEGEQIPPDWVRPQGADAIPSLRGLYFAPEYAEAVSDAVKLTSGNSGILQSVTNVMIRAMMLNPIPHMSNEIMHWFDSRGITGMLSPVRITKASEGWMGFRHLGRATRSVLLQDKDQIGIQREGGYLMYPQVRNARAWNDILQIGLKDAAASGKLAEMAKALGTAPFRLMKRVSDMSGAAMWAVRDILYTHLVMEQESMGLSRSEAIKEVGKHMPEYWIPSRVLGSRAISQVMQSKAVVFSPYHYGMLQALGTIGKELKEVGKPREFFKGLDHLAGLIVGMAVLYPLLDKAYQAMFNNENVEARRAGPYHPISAAGEVLEGNKDYPYLLGSLLTPSPAVSSAFELMQNRNTFTGKPIVYPGQPADVIAIEGLKATLGKLAPGQAATGIIEGSMTPEQYGYKQFDIIETDPDSQRRQERFRKLLTQKGAKVSKKIRRAYE